MSVFRRVAAQPLLPALALILAIAAAYLPSLDGDFLWDDDLHITANPTIVGPLGLKEIWTTSRANYFPLVLTNFRLQHALWGAAPLGYRLVTLGFHIAAALLLWRVLRALRVPGAWLGAALWALHPVQVESVAWICELKNTQSAVFFLAAIWFWLGPAEWLRCSAAGIVDRATMPRSRDYFLALLCAALALLSKPSTVMLPVALALVTGWQRRRFAWPDLFALAPFAALSALVAGWTIWEQKFHSGATGAEWSQTFPERLALAGRAVWFYLGKLLWPEPLAFIYPRWSLAATPGAFLPLLALAAAFVGLWRRRPDALRPALVAGLYFVALLFPVLGFFDVYFFRYSYVGDHFQYLASIGPLAALAAGLTVLWPRGAHRVGAAGVIALALLTAVQSRDYRSNEALWRGTLARNSESAMAWAQLGAAFERVGRDAAAMTAFQRALALNPRHPEALNHLGCAYLRAGRTAEGIAELEKAVAARPGFAEAQNNLGLALVQLDRGSEALSHLEAALHLRPDAAEPHYNLGKTLHLLGRTTEALAHYEQALAIEPSRAQTHDDFGVVLAAAGRREEAMAEHQRALQLQPTLASAHNNLGVLFAQIGRMPDALMYFDQALARDPAYVPALINRGGALAALERLPEACAAFGRALELDPDSMPAHTYLAQLLDALGREAEAQAHADRAAQLQRAQR